MIIVETETGVGRGRTRIWTRPREPIFVLGGGSNVLIGDAGFDGTVIKIATRGIAEDTAACSGAVITVAAGEQWDPLVQLSIERDWSGLEAMSGIPAWRSDADPERRRVRGRSQRADLQRCAPLTGPQGRSRRSFRWNAASAIGHHDSSPIPDAFWCSR